MTHPIQLDPELARELSEGMKFGSGVELPFSVLYLRVHNGKAAAASVKDLNPTEYYGGFVVDAEPVQDLLQAGLDLPGGFVGPRTMTTKEDKEYEAYTARHILVAPIGYRKSWYDEETRQRSPEFFRSPRGKAARHHIQMLALMGRKVGKDEEATYFPFHPVVITASGYQVGYVIKAFSEWNKHTAKVRNQVAPGVPANLFYLAFGTFGSKREQEMVGAGDNKSPITPVKAFLPDPLPEKLITSLFVGNDTALDMNALKKEAAEWLGAWSKPVTEGALNGEPELAEPDGMWEDASNNGTPDF